MPKKHKEIAFFSGPGAHWVPNPGERKRYLHDQYLGRGDDLLIMNNPADHSGTLCLRRLVIVSCMWLWHNDDSTH